MQKIIFILSIIVSCTLLSSCSSLQFPGVYIVTVEQGNIITQEMIDQLKPGMSIEQVEYVMGSPLIKDTFNAERWDYLYNIKKGKEPLEQHRLSLFFKAEKLDYFTGDFTPTSATQPSPAADSPVEESPATAS